MGIYEIEKNRDNRLVIIVKIEKYIEYMLTILLKLPRTEKFSIGTEVLVSFENLLKAHKKARCGVKKETVEILIMVCYNKKNYQKGEM